MIVKPVSKSLDNARRCRLGPLVPPEQLGNALGRQTQHDGYLPAGEPDALKPASDFPRASRSRSLRGLCLRDRAPYCSGLRVEFMVDLGEDLYVERTGAAPVSNAM